MGPSKKNGSNEEGEQRTPKRTKTAHSHYKHTMPQLRHPSHDAWKCGGQSNPRLGCVCNTGICVICGARQETIAICSSRRYVHSLCRLSVCRTDVCAETTSVVDTHELLMAGWRDDARGYAPLCQNLVWRLQNRKLAVGHAVWRVSWGFFSFVRRVPATRATGRGGRISSARR